MDWKAQWIKPNIDTEEVAPIFQKKFSLSEKVKKAELVITSLGVYEAMLNGKRVGNFVMAPGWTSYQYRLQYQTYDVTEDLQKENELTVAAGIRTEEEAPGYEKAVIAPTPDVRLDWLKGTLETPHGLISSAWRKVDGMWRYEITTPVETTIRISNKEYHVGAGTYLFYEEVK